MTPTVINTGGGVNLVNIGSNYDDGNGILNNIQGPLSVVGNGASIQTEQYIADDITSTGPLGDLILESSQGITNVTAPNFFGSILSGGPITGTIQTTGQRTDLITGVVSTVAAELGRVYVAFESYQGQTIPYLTATVVQAQEISGQIISRGNLVSETDAYRGMQGVLAAQGNLGKSVVNARGQTLLLGGIYANGGGGAIVSGGAIDNANAGTSLLINGNIAGILAAMETINFAKQPNGSYIFDDVSADPNDSDATAIDAVFAQSSFDISGLDLGGLDILLANLLALKVDSEGNLVD